MVGEWKKERLSDLCSEIADCPHSTPLWTDSGALVLRSQNIRNGRLDLSAKSYTDEAHFEQRSRRARLRGGDLVITREAPMGEICLIPDGLRCCLGQRMVMLRPDPKKCDSRFLLYSIQSRAVQDEIKVNEGTGSTVSNLRIPLLEALPIPHPPLAEQKAIAAVLGALDDKIELNRRMNATLEAMARALFQSWFVDFDPVRAKLDNRRPAGMDVETAALFPDSIEDSELGHIPAGWEVLPYRSLLEFENGDRGINYPQITDFVESGIPFINAGHLVDGAIDIAKVNRLTDETFANLRSGKIRRGDLLYCLRGSPGRVASVGRLDKGAIASSLVIIRPTSRSRTSYIYHTLSSAAGQQMASELNNGSAQPNVSVGSLSAYKVLSPPVQVQEAFSQVVAPLEARVEANRLESTNLRAIRDTLLPKLLSGELSVAEIEKEAVI